jgi:hypothetical protein
VGGEGRGRGLKLGGGGVLDGATCTRTERGGGVGCGAGGNEDGRGIGGEGRLREEGQEGSADTCGRSTSPARLALAFASFLSLTTSPFMKRKDLKAIDCLDPPSSPPPPSSLAPQSRAPSPSKLSRFPHPPIQAPSPPPPPRPLRHRDPLARRWVHLFLRRGGLAPPSVR